jgi:spermidine synthase
MLIPLLFIFSFIAGVSSLIFETVWIHRFSFVFGSTAPAASVVVAVFLGGLAIGSWYFGNISARKSNSLRVFAVLQLAIGVYAFLFPYILRGGDFFYAGVYPRIAESVAITTAVRIAMALIILILPTILMGGTLPLLLQGGMDRSESIGRRAGMLNAFNTVGAAMGGFLCGYVLLEQLGVRNAGFFAAVLNCAAGIAAWFLQSAPSAGGGARADAPEKRGQGEAIFPRSVVRLAVVCFTVSGFAGIAYEMLFLRYLVLYFRDTIYLYSGVISVFILWLGVGSAVSGALLKNIRWPVAALGFTQIAIGVFSFLAFYLPAPWHGLLSLAGRSSPASVFVFVLVLLAVPAMFMGAMFPLVARIVASDSRFAGKKIGAVYALNTAGSIAGSLATVFLLVPMLGMEAAIFVCVLMNLLMGAVVVIADRKFPRRKVALGICALGFFLPFAVKAVERVSLPLTILQSMILPGDEIVEFREGVTGTTCVTRAVKGGYELWSESVAISATRNGSFYAPGIVPVLLFPRIPESVLSLAFGGGLSSYGVRLFPEVKRLDCVDLSAENMDLALKHFPENAGFREDPRAQFVVDDARNYLRYSAATYDMVLVEATPPRFSFRNAFLFTKEFYEDAVRKLNRGGFFVQILPLADLSPAETRGVMKTFAAVFPERAMWFIGGPDVVMIGSAAPIVLNYGETARRLARPEIKRVIEERLSIAQYQSVGNLFSGYLLDSKAWDRAAEGGEVYTEDRLALMFSTGRERSTDNIRRIHERLTPWSGILGRVADRGTVDNIFGPGVFERNLEDRRQFFAAHMYGPNYFYPAMLNYIEYYALDKAGERARLYEVLRARGRDAEADDLAEGIRRSK